VAEEVIGGKEVAIAFVPEVEEVCWYRFSNLFPVLGDRPSRRRMLTVPLEAGH
jgi:hypothetical protein